MAPRRALAARRVVALLGLTSTLTLVCFGSSLGGSFVYDDEWTVVHNERLEWPLGTLLRACWKGDAKRLRIPDATRPLMVASTWIDRHLFGLVPAGYHAHSLVLHAVASALAALATFALTGRRRLAALAAVFFSTAPIHTEVVAAVNNREDAIAAIGVLGALTLLFWPRRLARLARAPDAAGTAPPLPAILTAALAAALWLAGLCAKESAVVLVPVAVAAWACHRRRRVFAGEQESMLLALLSVGVIWANWRVGLHFGSDDIPTAHAMGVAERVTRTARYEVWAVAGQILPFWPAPEHARPGPASAAWIAALGCLVGLAVLLARRRATRVPGLGLMVALAAPLATSPVVGPVNEYADRYLYLGVLGGSLIWSWGLDRAASAALRRTGWRPLVALAVAVGGACAALSARAARTWHDELSLWTEATRVAPESPRAWAGLSHAVRLAGRLDDALELSQRALEIDATYAPAHLTHAYNLLSAGRRDEALLEIRYLEDNAPDLPGLARGTECASLPAADAAACIDRR